MASIAMAIAAGILFASAVLWGTAIQRWRSGQPLLPMSQRAPAPWGLVDLAIAIAIWLFLNLAAIGAGRSALGLPPDADLSQLEPSTQKVLLLIGGIITLATCLLIVAALWIRHRVTLRDLGWEPQYLVGDLILGMKAFVMLAPIVYALQLMLTQLVDSKHPLIELLKKNPDPGFFATAAFAAVIVAPVVEEFVFRVLLQGWLERMFAWQREPTDVLVFGARQRVQAPPRDFPDDGVNLATKLSSGVHEAQLLNPYLSPTTATSTNSDESAVVGPSSAAQPRWTPIIVSSLFFAISHWSHGPDPIPLFVFALGLGYLYQRTNRIVPCILVHLLLNLCSLVGLWLAVMA